MHRNRLNPILTVLLATIGLMPALSSAQCVPDSLFMPAYQVRATLQAGALTAPNTVSLSFSEDAGVTGVSLDTGLAHNAQATVDIDLATGKIAYLVTSGNRSIDSSSIATASGGWIDQVCFDFPAGVTSADIQLVLNVTGSINCVGGGLTCVFPGTQPTFVQFTGQNITVPIRDLNLPSHQIVINATVVDGTTYPIQVGTQGATINEGVIDFSNSVDLQFILPEGVSFESASGVLLTSGGPPEDDWDGDGIPDDVDSDDDNDGVLDAEDDDPNDPFVCSDVDADTCDDCTVQVDGLGPLSDFDPFADGLDTDGDGICDAGDNNDTDGDGIEDLIDADDDNDGVLDDFDSEPTNVLICQDMDADTCDDCAVGVDGFGPLGDFDPFNDGPDSDGDGICDAGDNSFDDWDGDGIPDDTDSDDDNDGVPDADDSDPTDVLICQDMDADNCDDCSVGVDGFGPLGDFDPFNDGPDSDGDGICDAGDNNDTDGDGIDDVFDNCPIIANTDQTDSNGDGFGDACVPADTVIRNGVVIGSNPVIGLGSVIRKDVTIGDNVNLGMSVVIAKNSILGDNVSIGDQSKIRKDVQVGNNVSIGDNATVAKKSQIGDDVQIGNGTIIRNSVGIGAGVVIGDNVTIRKGAIILPGATVPDGTVVPKNSTFPVP